MDSQPHPFLQDKAGTSKRLIGTDQLVERNTKSISEANNTYE